MSIFEFVATSFAVAYLTLAIVEGSVLVHIYNWLYKKNKGEELLFTREDLKNRLMEKLPAFWFDLLHCRLCLCAWLAVLFPHSQLFPPLHSLLGIAGLAYFWVGLYKVVGKAGTQMPMAMGVSPVKPVKKQPLPVKVEEKEVTRIQKQGRTFENRGDDKGWVFLEEDPDRAKVIGVLDDPERGCGADLECWAIHKHYLNEVKELHRKAEEGGVECSECAEGNVRNKYYYKARQYFNKRASADKKIS